MLFQQQFLGLVDPDSINIIRKVFAGLFFEQAGEVAGALVNTGSNVSQGQFGSVVPFDECYGILHLAADVNIPARQRHRYDWRLSHRYDRSCATDMVVG